ncbi:MAG: NAD(P)-binding domain-containing protein [Bacteroides sp.]|nr:NAD(P)-binding domain-containing protein [Barnesiella sp.]MBD5367664.1 NAD(P)-binding domain-containing protein [Bacteroides sp.]
MENLQKIAIIGGGNMGGTLASALVENRLLKADNIVVATPNPHKCANLSANGVKVITSNSEAVIGADLVIIAVKPWILHDVVAQIKDYVKYDTEISAIVAGVSCDEFRNMWGTRCPDVLSIAMPNTAMKVLESMSFIVPVTGVPELAGELFTRLGDVEVIAEKQLGAATALASCGIAYAMRYIRAAMEGGTELGFSPETAKGIVCQTVLGAVKLIYNPFTHPEVEIDKVTTPGGLTIRGLNEMEKNGFSAAVIAGLKASAK